MGGGARANAHNSESDLTLDEYQRRSAATDIEPGSSDPVIPLLGLGGEVGALLAEFKKKRRPDGVAYTGFEDVVVTELGDILWYLAALARRVNVRLSDVAVRNLGKTRARWLRPDPSQRRPLDEGFPEAERLPRQFTVMFSSFDDAGVNKVRMDIAGEAVGDPIDDNARYSDDYRFHDAFHLGYLAVLGWSRVFRRLLRRKRKSDADTDRTEDGARACATEEAISAMVFELAKPYDYFDGVEHVDESILNAVQAITGELEVSVCTAAEWERAILVGFGLWRALRGGDGGTVRVDLEAGTAELTR